MDQARLQATPIRYNPGMRRWIDEDNNGRTQILGVCWLIEEHKRVWKLTSSLDIYMKEMVDISQALRMGTKFLRITEGDWDRYYWERFLLARMM